MTRNTGGSRSVIEYLLGGTAVFLILLMGAFSLAKGITARQREQATLALKPPTALVRYEQLSVRAQSDRAEGTAPAAGAAPIEQWASEDKLARWDHLLVRWERFMADKSDDGWRSVLAKLGVSEAVYDVSEEGKSPRELLPEEWTQVEACLGREQDLVNEIREVAQLGGPVCALDLTKWPPTSLPHHGRLRQLCGFLVWDASVKARAGEFEEALQSLTGGMRLGDALLEEPFVWSQFTRMAAINRQVTWALREGFEPGQVPSVILERMVDELGKAKRSDAFANAMRAEALIRVRHLTTSRTGKEKVSGIRNMNGAVPAAEGHPVGRAVLWVYAGPLGKPWFDLDLATFAEAMDRLAQAAEGPYYRAVPLLTSLRKEQLSESIGHPFAPFLLGGYEETFHLQAETEVMLDLTRIGLLIEAHRVQRGEYPKALDDLAPDLGGTVPRDPFSGEAYRYVLNDESFLLYSIGSNLRDDGGRDDWRDGDLRWR